MQTLNLKTTTIISLVIITTFHFHQYPSTLLSEPLRPPDFPTPNTVPSFPVQAGSQTTCRLDLSSELFGGVNAACARNLDRSRCCPVLAAWLFAAHARSALQIISSNSSSGFGSGSLPVMPDDSQRCVNSLQTELQKRNIRIPQANASCDAVLCFCGIRLHQIGSLSCPAAFNLTARNATPTAVVRDLERSCRNSSYAGCTKCLGALEKLKGEGKNGTKKGDRRSEMMSRDCQLMGLTWLLAKNKTAYIPTVSAILRALMYSAHPARCSPDQANMPLAVNSLQFDRSPPPPSSSAVWSSSLPRGGVGIVMAILGLMVFG